MTGAKGADITLAGSVGTQVYEEDNETLICDLTVVGQKFRLAAGGNGGFRQPAFQDLDQPGAAACQSGLPGQEMWVWLRLKLIADAGLVGLPNAGKSTFLASVTAAKPKIADYPFTTLHPNLGVARVDAREFVIADIPGLIEGAHEGVGIGDRFLGHVERTRVLLHLVSAARRRSGARLPYRARRIEAYGHGLTDKPESSSPVAGRYDRSRRAEEEAGQTQEGGGCPSTPSSSRRRPAKA